MLKDKDVSVRRRLKYVYVDLRAPITEAAAEDIGKVDYILHLAAGSHVDRSIEYPLEFVWDNVVGTVNLLEFARKYQPDLDRFVYFSTDEVFGPAPRGVDYDEYDRYNSGNPYSAGKAGGEEFAVAYENTYKMPIVVTHTMNVFGERQNPEKFIPGVLSAVMNGDQVYYRDICHIILARIMNLRLVNFYNLLFITGTAAPPLHVTSTAVLQLPAQLL